MEEAKQSNSFSCMHWKPPVVTAASQTGGWKASSEPFGLICQPQEEALSLAPRGWSCPRACLPRDGQPITTEPDPCPLLGRPRSLQESSSFLFVLPLAHVPSTGSDSA